MTVEGLARLNRKLTKRIPEAVYQRVREALEQSANETVAAMKALAPHDTGLLQSSIAWTWGNAPKGTLAIASSKASANGLRITIYAGGGEAYYARFVEFGTSRHINGGLYAGSENPGMTAQPFFYPGWRLVKRKVKGRVSRSVKKAIKEATW